MMKMDRRTFLELGGKLAVLLGVEATFAPRLAGALEDLSAGNAPVLWLQAQSCSGCSVSLLNAEAPRPAGILTRYLSMIFHSTISATSGHQAMDVIHRTIDRGGYYLVVEGSIPLGMPQACMLDEKPIGDLIASAARKAVAVISVGTCAAFGGIPAAENNPTGAAPVSALLSRERIDIPVINLPGCPMHPDWLVGTLVHVLTFGMPELDKLGRPTAFYGKLIHDQCPRFPDYERGNFAKSFGDDGCLFKLGCLGPITHADCTIRHWNGGTNTCIKAGAPCIGCASEEFAARMSLPFYIVDAHAREGSTRS